MCSLSDRGILHDQLCCELSTTSTIISIVASYQNLQAERVAKICLFDFDSMGMDAGNPWTDATDWLTETAGMCPLGHCWYHSCESLDRIVTAECVPVCVVSIKCSNRLWCPNRHFLCRKRFASSAKVFRIKECISSTVKIRVHTSCPAIDICVAINIFSYLK